MKKLLFLFMLLFLSCSMDVEAATTYKKVVIGDSRIVGVGMYGAGLSTSKETYGKSTFDIVKGAKGDTYFYGGVGMGLNWIKDNAVPHTASMCDSNTTVYIVAGVNDLDNASAYKTYCSSLSSTMNGAKIVFAGVGKVDESKQSNIKNSKIDKFNSTLSSSPSGYTYMEDFWVDNEIESTANDGIHYEADYYKKVYSSLGSSSNNSSSDSSSSSSSSKGSDGSWCKVTINQSKVGHASGCTVCSLQLMFQNSQTLDKAYQLSGCQTSNSGDYKKFNDLCEKSGTFQNGDSWTISKTIDFSKKYCGDTFSEASSLTNATVKEHKGNTSTIVGLGGKDFKDMTDKEQIDAMKTLWNNDYWVLFCVDYEGVDQDSNGPVGYMAAHVTMLAGVDDSKIYINDPATGTVCNYFERSAKGGAYKLMYCILYKNSKNSPKDLSGSGTIDSADGEPNSLGLPTQVFAGYCSEAELAQYCQLKEMNVQKLYLDNALRENLDSKETGVLSDWELNVDFEETESTPIKILRFIVQCAGIVFICWMILLYVAYWWDRLNTFIDLDLLGLLTGKKLVVSPDESECNFSLKDLSGGDARTINHKTLIKVCLGGIFFGCFIITGTIYKVLATIVYFIKDVLD